MVEPIFISPYFLEYILPFVLVFTLVFAILQKMQIFGEGKKQVDAIIGIVVGLILISFPFARNIVVNLMPFMVVSLIILFVFMLVWGFAVHKKGMDRLMNKGLLIAFGVIFGLGLITYVLMVTGAWDSVYAFLFEQPSRVQFWINFLIIGVLVGVIIPVVKSGKD